MYIIKETLEEVSEFDIRQSAYPSCLPAELTAELLNEMGFAEVIDIVPSEKDGFYFEKGDIKKIKGKYTQTYVEVKVPDFTKDIIANSRWEHEVGGIEWNGLHISTDDRSKLLINGAALESMIDENYSMKWKCMNGWVELTSSQIIELARLIRNHVQNCFNRESFLLSLHNSGEFKTEYLSYGWDDNYEYIKEGDDETEGEK